MTIANGIRLVFFTIVLILFVSCATAGDKVHERDRLVECSAEPVMVNVIMLPGDAAVRRMYGKYNPGQVPPTLAGFAIYNTRTKLHTLHVNRIYRQGNSKNLKTLGHELLHALCGDWHADEKVEK